MPRKRSTAPGYRYHVSGQAVVTLDGRNFYLGEHGSPQSWAKYYALLAEYNANGQRMPEQVETHKSDQPVTVRCLTAEFREHAKVRYAKNAGELSRYGSLCSVLEDEYGDDPVENFGPRKLAELRDLFVASGNCRKYVNTQTRCIVSIFRFGVSREIVKPEYLVALQTLEPLKQGQTKARESEPVQPVDIEAVRLTAKHLSPTVKAMVRIQAATGMRPSEVCKMRPTDIEKRPDGVWVYRPPTHKTAHHGKTKAVPLVGDAKLALKPFLDRPDDEYCFTPKESADWHRDQRSANRKTPMNQGDRPGYGKTARDGTRKERNYRPCFGADSYRRAIQRAAEKAGTDHWFPYQLRHTAGTVIREALGVEAAQAMLGHSRASMTEHYAKLSLEKAIEAAKAGPSV
ncbi:tyrosine-type recombinase/integrase [Crateriforma spongiae]|uniref:tyrosine-type recombinase/integrase n=1 Tax=Crateriforma spongiae TaxID=2724528 RepID=UPI0039B01090